MAKDGISSDARDMMICIDTALQGAQEQSIECDVLVESSSVQPRASISPSVVQAYVADMKEGDKFPAITVFKDGETYYLADGYHRLEATRQMEMTHIMANVATGTRSMAMTHAAHTNYDHGLPRTREDREKAVLTLIRMPEWAEASLRELAYLTHVSKDTVRKIRTNYMMERKEEDKGGRPSKKPKPKASLAKKDSLGSGEVEPADKSLGADDVGGYIYTNKVFDAFSNAQHLKNMMSQITQLTKRLTIIKNNHASEDEPPIPGTQFVEAKQVLGALRDAREILKFAVPYAICPHCNEKGCPACKDSGWMPKSVYKQAPSELTSS